MTVSNCPHLNSSFLGAFVMSHFIVVTTINNLPNQNQPERESENTALHHDDPFPCTDPLGDYNWLPNEIEP